LLPNLLTITAICAGLTAIRFGYEGDFEMAVRLILLACLLDGIDGHVARLLKCQSAIGAELDSLADFVNFGVAPALLIHAWAFQDFRSAGWIAVLGYAICCVLRLARFNVAHEDEPDDIKSDFFEGIPSPAGAMLVLLPMYISFQFWEIPLAPAPVIAVYVFAIGLLMISKIQTFAFTSLLVSGERTTPLLLAIILIIAALMTYIWATLIFLTFGYVASLIWASRFTQKSKE
jgi:CDP-diacylglycerol--serine O-phosphatidyltransferase